MLNPFTKLASLDMARRIALRAIEFASSLPDALGADKAYAWVMEQAVQRVWHEDVPQPYDYVRFLATHTGLRGPALVGFVVSHLPPEHPAVKAVQPPLHIDLYSYMPPADSIAPDGTPEKRLATFVAKRYPTVSEEEALFFAEQYLERNGRFTWEL